MGRIKIGVVEISVVLTLPPCDKEVFELLDICVDVFKVDRTLKNDQFVFA